MTFKNTTVEQALHTDITHYAPIDTVPAGKAHIGMTLQERRRSLGLRLIDRPLNPTAPADAQEMLNLRRPR